jgi:hypothetical protein
MTVKFSGRPGELEAFGTDMKIAMGMPMSPKKKEMPAQTRAEMRAQLRRRKRPMPVAIPNMEQAIATAMVTMPTILTNGGCSIAAVGKVTNKYAKRLIPVPSKTNKLPRIATTPAAIVEADGLVEVPIHLSVYHFQERRQSEVKVTREQLGA